MHAARGHLPKLLSLTDIGHFGSSVTGDIGHFGSSVAGDIGNFGSGVAEDIGNFGSGVAGAISNVGRGVVGAVGSAFDAVIGNDDHGENDSGYNVPDFINTQAIVARALCQSLAFPKMVRAVPYVLPYPLTISTPINASMFLRRLRYIWCAHSFCTTPITLTRHFNCAF